MHGTIQLFSSGDRIFAQGAKADSVYYLLGGRIGLWLDQEKNMNLEPIHILGLESCFSKDQVYICSAVAETDARLIAYASDRIPELLFANSQLGLKTLESLAKQLGLSWRLFRQKERRPDSGVFFAGEIQTFGPGACVIREDEPSTEMYRIISTSEGLEVSKQGKALMVIREPGEFFGEMAAVTRTPRTATVTSLGESVLEVYPGDILGQVVEDYPEVARRIITSLSERLAETNRLLTGE